MSNHTKGPWSVEVDGNTGLVYICHPETEDDTTTVNYELTKDDANRIVACVNACDGIPTKVLEFDSLELRGWKSVYAEKIILTNKVSDLEALLLESKDMAVDLLNYVESSGWTRHRDNEITETKAYIEKVDKALGTKKDYL